MTHKPNTGDMWCPREARYTTRRRKSPQRISPISDCMSSLPITTRVYYPRGTSDITQAVSANIEPQTLEHIAILVPQTLLLSSRHACSAIRPEACAAFWKSSALDRARLSSWLVVACVPLVVFTVSMHSSFACCVSLSFKRFVSSRLSNVPVSISASRVS